MNALSYADYIIGLSDVFIVIMNLIRHKGRPEWQLLSFRYSLHKTISPTPYVASSHHGGDTRFIPC